MRWRMSHPTNLPEVPPRPSVRVPNVMRWGKLAGPVLAMGAGIHTIWLGRPVTVVQVHPMGMVVVSAPGAPSSVRADRPTIRTVTVDSWSPNRSGPCFRPPRAGLARRAADSAHPPRASFSLRRTRFDQKSLEAACPRAPASSQDCGFVRLR
jgi:hypothetical protein